MKSMEFINDFRGGSNPTGGFFDQWLPELCSPMRAFHFLFPEMKMETRKGTRKRETMEMITF